MCGIKMMENDVDREKRYIKDMKYYRFRCTNGIKIDAHKII